MLTKGAASETSGKTCPKVQSPLPPPDCRVAIRWREPQTIEKTSHPTCTRISMICHVKNPSVSGYKPPTLWM